MSTPLARVKRGRKSLWGSLTDGTVGPGVRLVASLAVALILAGLAFPVAYFVCLLIDNLDRPPGSPFDYAVGIYPGVALIVVLVTVLAILLVVGRLWQQKWRGFVWHVVAKPGAVWVMATLLALMMHEVFSGDDEEAAFGFYVIAAGVTLWMWAQACHRFGGGRELLAADGTLDVRCPKCQYRMVGLKETRCPECGQEYTIDRLLAEQDFEALRSHREVSALTVPDDDTQGR